MTTRTARAGDTQAPSPWWRVGVVWLVVGGPLVVVVASVITAVIAFRGADQLLRDEPSARAGRGADVPAISARNHAATPAR